MKHIQCAVGILYRQNEVLLSQRQSEKIEGGSWEFPGGKIEPSETPYEALVRELYEEVGIVVKQAAHFMRVTHDYQTYLVTLEIFLVEQFARLPYGREGQAVQWTAIEEAENLYIPTPNQQIITRLKEHFAKL